MVAERSIGWLLRFFCAVVKVLVVVCVCVDIVRNKSVVSSNFFVKRRLELV